MISCRCIKDGFKSMLSSPILWFGWIFIHCFDSFKLVFDLFLPFAVNFYLFYCRLNTFLLYSSACGSSSSCEYFLYKGELCVLFLKYFARGHLLVWTRLKLILCCKRFHQKQDAAGERLLCVWRVKPRPWRYSFLFVSLRLHNLCYE